MMGRVRAGSTMMRRLVVLLFTWCYCYDYNVIGFQFQRIANCVRTTKLLSQSRESDRHLGGPNVSRPSPAVLSRKRWIQRYLSLGIGVVSGVATMSHDAANAAPNSSDQKDTLWLTGKEPVVPGQAPRDKNDVKGTRKDPNFLRSIADCKNQCENSTGPDGLARTKEECLSECQDICCQTYQQCTFGIVPRI